MRILTILLAAFITLGTVSCSSADQKKADKYKKELNKAGKDFKKGFKKVGNSLEDMADDAKEAIDND